MVPTKTKEAAENDLGKEVKHAAKTGCKGLAELARTPAPRSTARGLSRACWRERRLRQSLLARTPAPRSTAARA